MKFHNGSKWRVKYNEIYRFSVLFGVACSNRDAQEMVVYLRKKRDSNLGVLDKFSDKFSEKLISFFGC